MNQLNDITKLFGEDYNNQQIANLVLRDLNTMFKTEVGIISNIKNSIYMVKAASSVYNPGDTFELKDTYCCVVVDTQKPFSIANVGESECTLKKHPLYIKRKIESYLACPLYVGGEFYGTMNFSSSYPRSPFTKKEMGILNRFAREIEKILPL